MIGIVDYGVGNLFSLQSSLFAIGAESKIISDSEKLYTADKLILPGVGAFSDAMQKLRACNMDRGIRNYVAEGKEILGICLGMQMLFSESREYGVHSGLGFLEGTVIPIKEHVPQNLKIPHIGWNGLHITRKNRLLSHLQEGECVYFVHSYFADCPSEEVIAVTEYGKSLTAAVNRDNVWGCQFHPEKSGTVGLGILKAFCQGGDTL